MPANSHLSVLPHSRQIAHRRIDVSDYDNAVFIESYGKTPY